MRSGAEQGSRARKEASAFQLWHVCHRLIITALGSDLQKYPCSNVTNAVAKYELITLLPVSREISNMKVHDIDKY